MRLLRVGIIVTIVLLFIPRVVHAGESAQVYFYCEESEDTTGGVLEQAIDITFEKDMTTEQKALVLFEALFSEDYKEYISFVPKDASLLWVSFGNGKLVINLSSEAKGCAGNYREEHFVKQILKTAYSLNEIRGIILYIDGIESELPEGTDFNSFNR